LLRNTNFLRKRLFLISSILFVLITGLFYPQIIFSRTLEEVEEELEEKESKLEDLESDLSEAKEAAEYFQSKKVNTSSTLEQVKLEIDGLQAEIDKNNLELEKIESNLELLELELEKDNMIMDEKLVDLYIYNRQGIVDVMVENGNMDGFWKDYKYREKLLDIDIEGLNELGGDIESILEQKKSLEASRTVLEEEHDLIVSRKSELEEQVNYYASMQSYNVQRQEGIRSQMGSIQKDKENLTAEQQKMLAEEARIIADAKGGTQPLESGEFYFYGRGRYIYQGHGLGFSQYGAMGGANNGMSAEEIAAFYYPGSFIGSHVDETVEDRISYLGEIPDYACGSQEQVNERPDKYKLDNPSTIWDCWPEESIKAQIIVSRSYAYTGGTDQVYKSTNYKKWAVEETRGVVLKHASSLYRDGVIKAFFSADNNNGWGTGTHKKPIFCSNFHGDCGNGYPWLQAVNDSSFAAKGPYTDWIWRTNSYNMQELESMLIWYGQQSFTYPYSSDVANLMNNIGSLEDIDLEKDISGRVAKVWLTGGKGKKSVNGDFFKTVFIFWVYNVKPTGEVDPIFSLTYHFSKVP